MPGNTTSKAALPLYLQMLSDSTENIPESYRTLYTSFLETLSELNEQTDLLYERDENGSYFPMTAAETENISRLYDEAFSKCEDLIRSTTNDPPQGSSVEPLKYIRELLGADIAALKSAPVGQQSLPDIIESGRGITLEINDLHNINSLSGNISTRRMISYTTPDGRTVNGFFTPSTRTGAYEGLRSVLLDLKAKDALHGGAPHLAALIDEMLSPEKETQFQALIDHYKDLILQEPNSKNLLPAPEFDTVFGIKDYYARANDYPGESEHITMAVRAFFSGTMRQEVIYTNPVANTRSDSHNTAMSSVASLFGISHVLAHSTNMSIRDGDSVIKGTFMEEANGFLADNIPKNDDGKKLMELQKKFKTFVNTPHIINNHISPQAMRHMAELDALDYICHNIDRHFKNYAYQFHFDANGKPSLTGVQGYDNDASFGTKSVNADEKYSISIETTLDALMVIPESLANTLKNINPDELRFALRNCDMPEVEIEAAVARLDALNYRIAHPPKNNMLGIIEPGVIQVVRDDEWDVYDFSSFVERGTMSNFKYDNIFEKTFFGISDFKQTTRDPAVYAEGKENTDPLKDLSDSFIGANGSLHKDVGTLDAIVGKASRLTSFGSKNFANFETALKEFTDIVNGKTKFYDKKAGAPDRKEIPLDLRIDAHFNRLKAALENLSAKADKYLVDKGKPSGKVATERVAAAKNAKAFADEQLKDLLKAQEVEIEYLQKSAWKLHNQQSKDLTPMDRAKGNLLFRCEKLPEGSDIQKLGKRAIAAQDNLIKYSCDANEPYSSPVEAAKDIAAMVAFDMAMRAYATGKDPADIAKVRINADKLIEGLLNNEVFKQSCWDILPPENAAPANNKDLLIPNAADLGYQQKLADFIESGGYRHLNNKVSLSAEAKAQAADKGDATALGDAVRNRGANINRNAAVPDSKLKELLAQKPADGPKMPR